MHPYRERAADEPIRDAELHRDDQILAFLAIAVGGIRVAIAIVAGETFGAEATIATVIVVIGLALLGAGFKKVA